MGSYSPQGSLSERWPGPPRLGSQIALQTAGINSYKPES